MSSIMLPSTQMCGLTLGSKSLVLEACLVIVPATLQSPTASFFTFMSSITVDVSL